MNSQAPLSHDYVESISRVVKDVGGRLRDLYAQQEPVIEFQAMMAAFSAIDGKAGDWIREGVESICPGIPWGSGELDPSEAWQPDRLRSIFWICDAIDGAVQYLRHIPHWCLSLTLVDQGIATSTFVYDAMHDELFHAIRSQGAFCNGIPVRVNEQTGHANALLVTTHPPMHRNDLTAVKHGSRSIERVLRQAGAVRNLGPTSLQLAYVAAGRLDGFWEYGEDVFNCLGGALMVAEAGGYATTLDGTPYGIGSLTLCAAPPAVHATLLATISNT